jgi:hypothetical protein
MLSEYDDLIREILGQELCREPTDREVADFVHYLVTDLYDWLKENARSWARNRVTAF